MSSEQTFETVKIQRDGHVAEVVLNRPEVGNAFNGQLFTDLHDAFEMLDADDRCRAIVLRAEGKAFTYGLDLMSAPVDFGPVLSEGLAGARLDLRILIERLQVQTGKPAVIRKPVVAAVHGWCIGAGLDLISACDIRLCTADARFSLREARVAMVADIGSLQRLPRIIGDAATRELALTAKDIDADRALSLGLVSQVHDDREAVYAAARAEAQLIASLSPVAVQGVKHVLNEQDGMTVQQGLDYVATWNAAFLQSEDLKEAFSAFFEKRTPEYKGQ
jgi:enoyl-CoA hydratase/carnithine racemase